MGNPMVPFDRWFGTFHDGSPEAHARMQKRWGEERDSHIVGIEG